MNSAAAPSNSLTSAELKAFEVKKTQFFKGTIAVCAVYGGFAALLILVAVFDARGRQILSEDLLPFIITLVSVMILIIIVMVIKVVTFKPKKGTGITYDSEVCPDYWKLEKVSSTDIPSGATDEEKQLMAYKCVPDPNVYVTNAVWTNNVVDLSKTGISLNSLSNVYDQALYATADNYTPYAVVSEDDDASNKLKEISPNMYSSLPSLSNIVYCDKVFPTYLASVDERDFPEQPNSLRCTYAKKCGISWSSVCPDA